VVLAMVEKLASISSELAIERDWVTQLAGKQNMLALARSNAYLRRTDLLTELVGALAFGWIYSRAGCAAAMAFTGLLAAAAAPAQLLFIRRIAALAPAAMVHGRQEPGAGWAHLPDWRTFVENARLRWGGRGGGAWAGVGRQGLSFTRVPACLAPLPTARRSRPVPPRRRVHAAEAAARRQPLASRARRQLAHALDGWRSYFRQPILPSSLTFVLLFFNVVLSPGGLITHFLTLWGFDGNAMALFRSGCASEAAAAAAAAAAAVG
jgi:iron-regulated transporter 1